MSIYINELTAATELASTDVMHLRTTGGIDKKITGENVKKIAIPVGFIYIQFPGESSPSTLGFPGTWANISSNFAGDFIRAEGGNASVFESGEQNDAFQGHRHTARFSSYLGSGSTSGPRQAVGTFTADIVGDPITDGVNGTPRTDDETRAINRTVRVWERTA